MEKKPTELKITITQFSFWFGCGGDAVVAVVQFDDGITPTCTQIRIMYKYSACCQPKHLWYGQHHAHTHRTRSVSHTKLIRFFAASLYFRSHWICSRDDCVWKRQYLMLVVILSDSVDCVDPQLHSIGEQCAGSFSIERCASSTMELIFIYLLSGHYSFRLNIASLWVHECERPSTTATDRPTDRVLVCVCVCVPCLWLAEPCSLLCSMWYISKT